MAPLRRENTITYRYLGIHKQGKNELFIEAKIFLNSICTLDDYCSKTETVHCGTSITNYYHYLLNISSEININ